MPGSHRMPTFLFLACLVFSAVPSRRADGAFASATNEVEFNWAVAQYIACTANPSAQCWNLVLDPFGVSDVDVTIQFETDVVAVGPEVIFITPGDDYDFGIRNDPVVVNHGNNQSEIQNLSFSVIDQTPSKPVDVFSIEFLANPNFVRPLGSFSAEVSNVMVEDLDTGVRELVPNELVRQPGPARIQPLLIPCDFDRNQTCDVADINSLTMAIADGVQDPLLDVNRDGAIDLADLEMWRKIAATENGLSGPYPNGDSNLDGRVNAVDLNQLAIRWQQTEDRWSNGDFNASGFVDVVDLNLLAVNWRLQVPPAQAVPEPHAFFLLLSAIALLSPRRKIWGSRAPSGT